MLSYAWDERRTINETFYGMFNILRKSAVLDFLSYFLDRIHYVSKLLLREESEGMLRE